MNDTGSLRQAPFTCDRCGHPIPMPGVSSISASDAEILCRCCAEPASRLRLVSPDEGAAAGPGTTGGGT